MDKQQLTSLILRIGLAAGFLYAATAALITPTNWIGYFPKFLQNAVPENVLLPLFSVYEIVLSLWLLSGKKVFYAAILAAISLGGIVIVNLGAMDIVFRDVPLALAAIALAILQ